MAQLDCAAQNCAYNKSDCCCKGDIMVGGKHAGCTDDTCCESFSEQRGDSFTNAMDKPSMTISIDCDAVKCVHNSNYKCFAEHVAIKGCDACECKETACSTFQEK